MENKDSRSKEEEWKPINNEYGEYYDVSNLGRIRDKKTGKISIQKLKGGYPTVSLYSPSTNKGYTVRVNKLVAGSFLKDLSRKMKINHINGNKTDNRACNLEWCPPPKEIFVDKSILNTSLYMCLSGASPIHRRSLVDNHNYAASDMITIDMASSDED